MVFLRAHRSQAGTQIISQGHLPGQPWLAPHGRAQPSTTSKVCLDHVFHHRADTTFLKQGEEEERDRNRDRESERNFYVIPRALS